MNNKVIKNICIGVIVILIATLLLYLYLKKPDDYFSDESIELEYNMDQFINIVDWAMDYFDIDKNNLVLDTCLIIGEYPNYNEDVEIIYYIIDTKSGNKRYPYKIYRINYNYSKNSIKEIYSYYEDTIHTNGIDMEQMNVSFEDVMRVYPNNLGLKNYQIDFTKRLFVKKIDDAWNYNFYDIDGKQVSFNYKNSN